jgi:DNA-directed RNA polymerase subunit K/omega
MTDFKNTKAPVSTVTINRDAVSDPTDNIYMAIVIIAKRAEQIQQQMKDALKEELQNIDNVQEMLQEIFEDTEHIEISKKYEKLPKPWAIALQEWLEGKIQWRFADESDRDKVF